MDSTVAYLIPIVAIVGGITFAIFSQYFKTKRRIADHEGSPGMRAELARSNELNGQLLDKLTDMEARLTSIERTLNEVG